MPVIAPSFRVAGRSFNLALGAVARRAIVQASKRPFLGFASVHEEVAEVLGASVVKALLGEDVSKGLLPIDLAGGVVAPHERSHARVLS